MTRKKTPAEHDAKTCWQWDHACYAKRLRAGRAKPKTDTGAARIRGKIVPNVRLVTDR